MNRPRRAVAPQFSDALKEQWHYFLHLILNTGLRGKRGLKQSEMKNLLTAGDFIILVFSEHDRTESRESAQMNYLSVLEQNKYTTTILNYSDESN